MEPRRHIATLPQIVLALAVCFAATAHAEAQAEDRPQIMSSRLRPTGDQLSIHSGRTMGGGEIVISGAAGFPGAWFDVMFAPSSRLNISVRGHFDYGTLLGTKAALGGGVSVPVRVLVYAHGDIDVALRFRPFFFLGEGAYVGQTGTFADDLGFATGSDGGLRAGYRVSEKLTLLAGAEGTFIYFRTPDADASDVGAYAHAVAGAELSLNRSLMLFATFRAGYAFAPDRLFHSHVLLRAYMGVSYRL